MHDGYFQVIAEPVSTWVHEIFDRGAAAVAALGDEIVDAALALGVAGVPVLHRRVFDLGVLVGDELDDRGVELVLVALGRRAALEIADIGALIGDDQRALELAGVLLVDAEIGRQLHRAAHAGRHVDERAVGEHRRIERRVEIVGRGHHRAEIASHQVAVVTHRLGERTEDHARLGELGLEGGGDGDRVEHRVDGDPPLDAGEDLLLDQRNAELGVGAQQLGIDLVERLRAGHGFRRREIIEVLEVNLGKIDPRPARRRHRQPAPVGLEAPVEQPLRLALLGRDEADDVLVEALGGLFRVRYP